MNPPGLLSARALLRAEGRGLRIVRAVVRDRTTRLVGAVAALPGGPRRRTAEQAVALVREHAAPFIVALTEAVRDVRQGAKNASLARFGASWTRVRRGVQVAGFPDPGELSRLPWLTPTDEAAALQVGQSLSSAWMNGMVAASWAWTAREENDPRTLPSGISAVDVDGRVRRIVATEAARAFADEFDDSAGWLAEQHGKAPWFSAVLKYWEAANDRKVCAVCSAMGDSLPRPIGAPFPGGHEPGYAHQFCRCVPELIFLPVRLPRRTTSGRQVDDFAPRSPLELPREAA